jgi:hypothetical protein
MSFDWWAANHVDYHGTLGTRDAAKTGADRRRPDKSHRGYDFAGLRVKKRLFLQGLIGLMAGWPTLLARLAKGVRNERILGCWSI